MVFYHMLSKFFYFFAVQVDQPSALLAFAVITRFLIFPGMLTHILKAGTAGAIDHILRDRTVLHQSLQMAIYGRRSNGDAFLGKCVTYLIHRNMSALNRFQKGKKFSHLFRSVLKLSHTESLLQFENLFQISTNLFSCQVQFENHFQF